jgi:hypothetical protein
MKTTPRFPAMSYLVGALIGCASGSGAGGRDAGSGGAPMEMIDGNGGSGGSGGAGGGSGDGPAAMDAGGVGPVDVSPPRFPDAGVAPVGPMPPAAWVNVTANLAGMPSECGNTPYLAAHPAFDLLITSVAQHGLWASSDGGTSWRQLWPTAGSAQITNRGSSIVFDPQHPDTFWESGIYNGPGVYRTDDKGLTFTALGNAHHIDSVSVDLGDPARLTLLAGGHEQKQTLYRSADGGQNWINVGMNLPTGTNFCTNALVIDRNIHLVGCSGYAGGTDGVFRTTDGGQNWKQVSTASAAGLPLWASDGTIYWSLIYDHGLIKSTDQGNTWTQTIPNGTLKTGHPIELPDGRIVAPGPKTLMISADRGGTFNPLGAALPFMPNSVTYSPFRNALFIEQFDCKNAVVADAISRYGFDYRQP